MSKILLYSLLWDSDVESHNKECVGFPNDNLSIVGTAVRCKARGMSRYMRKKDEQEQET